MCAFPCCFQHLWMTNWWTSYTSFSYHHVGWYEAQVTGKFSSCLKLAYEILICKRLHCFVYYMHVSFSYLVVFGWYNMCNSWKSKCIVWAERNRMGGFVRTGAHMLVNLQAGNCTGIRRTNIHVAHNIHPICHLGPLSSWCNTSSSYFSWPCSVSHIVFSSIADFILVTQPTHPPLSQSTKAHN